MLAVCGERFSGVVFSGRGEGSFYVSIYSKNFRRVLGFNPYPGTLNVRIIDERLVGYYSNCIRMVKPIRVEPPNIPGSRLGGVLIYRAIFMGLESWIVRPDITFYKDDVVEFISPISLRRRFGLSDGDKVWFALETPT